jgi:hypothetical protein
MPASATWWQELAALARDAQGNQPPGDITRLIGTKEGPWADTDPDAYVGELRDDRNVNDAA